MHSLTKNSNPLNKPPSFKRPAPKEKEEVDPDENIFNVDKCYAQQTMPILQRVKTNQESLARGTLKETKSGIVAQGSVEQEKALKVLDLMRIAKQLNEKITKLQKAVEAVTKTMGEVLKLRENFTKEAREFAGI